MKIGIIGTGNMGRILIEAFIDSGFIDPSDVFVTNRTKEKAERLQNNYPHLHVMDDAVEVIERSDVLFICVKPIDIYSLLRKTADSFSRDKLLISITSPVAVNELESVVDCSVARAIPSITNRALSGVSLITFGESCGEKERKDLIEIMGAISKPYEIEENITRVASDIVSCGPAFFTYLTERFIQAAKSKTEISEEQATAFASEMLIGMGQLLKKNFYTLPSLREKVHVKGGVTGVG
ncbi:MAG TPA: late competence protein ComER, partial [Bacillales bacterium]|nr:late competence protein ComER [Bacillales bacterium]